ncbi:ADP-heptose:LPS heptosyltransferase [Wenyingzhuangia heitensis]|uniref:ADP-heptose:LPS heptosyltransferase n=1 Tax=Wenyingzhuangia heitensis TaxID=1487859 RepID=A0ABX0U419_9FLAO|nr:glycosyltransferase family 9 protein [Wenyingzhuangia heitensis]NIJ43609.1 ADP-heptose:LPS heptosyltransferase [Wenyingzhuangia heitensis]
MQNKKHLLVIRMSAMGDVAMTVPVLKTLLSQNKNLKITVVSKGFLKPLFDNIEHVSFFAADTKGKHKGTLGIYKLYKELKKLNIDAVADLHNVLRSKLLRILFKIDGTPVAFINKGRAEKKALTAIKNKVFKVLKTTHQRYADVFNSLGFSVDLINPSLKEKEVLSNKLMNLFDYIPNEKLIGIAPFAAHDGKKYPLELIEEVVIELSKNHKILLFGGGQSEVDTLTTITQKHKNTFCLAGQVKLKDELAIISNLSVMISMDSGNGHFSALYGIPTISIWGATHPSAGFAPFNQIDNCICANRKQYPLLPTSVYGNKIVPNYENVMKTITPKTIINKVLSIIN